MSFSEDQIVTMVIGTFVVLVIGALTSCNVAAGNNKAGVCKEAIRTLPTISQPAQSDIIRGCQSFM